MTDRVKSAAQVIASARLAGDRLPPLAQSLRPRDEAEAYVVQGLVHELLVAGAGQRVGYKIGCTTRVMQDYLSIPSPCYAGVFTRGVHASGIVLSPADYRRIGIECEIAVRLGPAFEAGLPPSGFSRPGVIDSVHAAIEIVDDRYVDWRTIGAPTLIADDFFAAGCVLGPAVKPGEAGDLSGLSGVTRINGVEVGQGRGRDVMGHPANAVGWLAAALESNGGRLAPGDLVLTGSLVETRWLEAGDSAEIEISELGSVALSVAEL
jgi:2-keto-4-pentenoate hydratase